MPIDTSWNTVKKPHGNLRFNVNVGGDGKNGNPPPDYYPLVVNIDMPRQTVERVPDQVVIVKNIGINQPTPFDFSTIQGLKNVHTALPSWARGAFKEAVIAAINEDPSV